MIQSPETEKDSSHDVERLVLAKECLANIYLFNVKNRNTTKRCETCSKLTIKTPE